MSDDLVELYEPDPEFAEGFVIPGYKERVTETRGFRIVSLDVEADPAKRDPFWLQNERKRQPNESKFRREYLRDWNVGDGDVFFPEFLANGGRGRYVMPLHMIPGPVYRGWDFGRRAPACVWFQYDQKQRRILLLRSLTPTFMGIHSFRDLVLFLSGQLDIEGLDLHARQWLAKIEADPVTPRGPWFEAGNTPLSFVDYGGWEAIQESDMVREESQAKSRAEVLEEAGIYLTEIAAATHRDTLMRRQLGIRPDGWPGLLIDPSNELFIRAMAGGLVFKKPTLEEPMPSVYQKDGVHDNVYEAFTYGLVGVVPLNVFKAPAPVTTWDDRRRVVSEPVSGFGFKEGRT